MICYLTKFWWILGILIVVLFGCQEPKMEALSYDYFDANEFTNRALAALNKQQPKVFKEVNLNGETSTSEVLADSLFLADALSIIRTANINQASMMGKYSVDTVSLEGDITYIYKALSNDLKVKEVRLSNEGKTLNAKIANSNFMTAYGKKIEYDWNHALTIKGWQKTLLSDTVHYANTLTFE